MTPYREPGEMPAPEQDEPAPPAPLLCRLGLHRKKYKVHVEHGIIDGPPRRFAHVTCTRCGADFGISRDAADCERAEAYDLELRRARYARERGIDRR